VLSSIQAYLGSSDKTELIQMLYEAVALYHIVGECLSDGTQDESIT
jgi:hypothetical protein